MQKQFSLFVCLFLTLCTTPCLQGDIIIDYTHDTAGFFSGNATAKSALEAAANDISKVLRLGGSLGSISEAQNDLTGTNGSTTATASYSLGYSNPETGASETWDPFSLGQDEIRIFVGMRNLSGSTLGQGGPGSFSVGFSGSGFASEWVGAVADMEAQSNAVLGRGHGPTISTIEGGLTLGGTPATYSISKGVTHGNLWFDSDTDNDGDFDTNAELEASWHFNHNTSVAAGKNDFYSVALHEILHSIGYGTSESFDDLIDGDELDGDDDDWLGANAIAENGGTGVDLIDDGHGHLASGTMSTSIVDGLAQEAVMTPSITTGTRKHLTHLDIAILKDIGFTNAAAVPEPGTLAMLSVLSVGGVFLARRKRARWIASDSDDSLVA